MTMFGKRTRKKGSKVKMIVAAKRIYTDSVRTLHKRFNEDQEHPISLTAFFKYNHFMFQSQVKKRSKVVCVFIV